MQRAAEQRADLGLLGLAAGIHDDDALRHLGDDAEIVGDQHDRGVDLLLQLAQQIEDLRLDGHVERGRRLVGDEQLGLAGERHRDHHPLPHAARQLVRVFAGAPLGFGDVDEAQHLDGLGERRLVRQSLCRVTVSAICRPTVSTGFSDVIGSWKIIEISLPRTSRIAASVRPRRSRPAKRIAPDTIRPAARRSGAGSTAR